VDVIPLVDSRLAPPAAGRVTSATIVVGSAAQVVGSLIMAEGGRRCRVLGCIVMVHLG
jgi:hypothetical protein